MRVPAAPGVPGGSPAVLSSRALSARRYPPLPAKVAVSRQRGEINIVGGSEGQDQPLMAAVARGTSAMPARIACWRTNAPRLRPRGGWCRVPPGVSRRVGRPAHRVRRPAGRRRRRFRPAEYQKKDPAAAARRSAGAPREQGCPIVCRRALARSIQPVDSRPTIMAISASVFCSRSRSGNRPLPRCATRCRRPQRWLSH